MDGKTTSCWPAEYTQRKSKNDFNKNSAENSSWTWNKQSLTSKIMEWETCCLCYSSSNNCASQNGKRHGRPFYSCACLITIR
ncbi:hypothetical protein HNY73_000734 [Argiope bruennichi]|uniref:Uncharacterized protein n=1 Tax=Argiope bruennichi TaxID=94029 RepID=A0A8T0FZ85_ARGBR|nr:hypothetical protein HNY73_000734 [Argiope bruennichi]